ncbi:MAG: DNA polymerase III subunit gamma/tau [Bacteroidota bacterium]|nr:DNA polymerase III subunit gamma/tau [Bacteroidota bacterium]
MSDQPYLVSARKYRPQAWDAVVGQSGITQTLQQSIASGQIAQAYLFCGPRGVGKTTSARIFARAINGFEVQDEAMSFNVFELDAASNNKVEDIRSIVDQVRIPPQQGKYKVYIIDEVHMLSQAAFNAFLKTLEEPPAHAVFILATTEKHKILPTILSRCQIFDFHRITVPDAVAHLQHIASEEGVNAEEEALHVIAQKADGALRDALSMFDQLVAFAGKNLTYQAVTEQLHVLDHDTYFTLTDQALASDIPGAMLLFNDVMARGFDAHHFITGWANHLRNLMVCRDPQTLRLVEATDDVKAKFQDQASRADLFFLVGGLDVLNQADVQYRGSQHQRLLVELALMQICSHEALKKKSPDAGLMVPQAVAVDPALGPDVAPPQAAIAAAPVTPPASSPPEPPATPVPVPVPKAAPVQAEPVEAARAPVEPEAAPEAAPMPEASAPVAPVPEKEAPSAPAAASAIKAPRAAGLRKAKQQVVAATGNIKVKSPEERAAPAPAALIDPTWSEEVTVASLVKAWKGFVEKLREDDRLALTATMSIGDPELRGLQVVYTVNNPLQREQMDGLRTEVLIHLKTNLKNAGLELHLEMREQALEERKAFLSEKDRYDLMVEKNPALDKLRKALDLDLG